MPSPQIVGEVNGRATILFDSGIRTGLDIIRALASGADFVLLGRAFMYGVAALGEYGGEHVTNILKMDLINNMTQLGVRNIAEVKSLVNSGSLPKTSDGVNIKLSQNEEIDAEGC